MRKKFLLAAVLWLFLAAQPLHAWFDGGHMVVAYIAYQNLTPTDEGTRRCSIEVEQDVSHVDQGRDRDAERLTAFVKAATWADCIKQQTCAPGYTSDGGDVPPGNPSDTQNIGYRDMLMHRYWHFIDLPFSAGAPGLPPKFPNAQTEIVLFTKAIAGTESDNVKSYDVVWLEHLVGDVHQPLHATSRFTKDHPAGDNGGNSIHFCAKPCTDELHAFWDGLLGDKVTVAMATTTGRSLLATGKPAGADNLDPTSWTADSLRLAKADVYVPPISDDNDPSVTISPSVLTRLTRQRRARSRALK